MDAKEMIRELSERIRETANVKVVFGEPMGEGSSLVIPVARVSVRGGGGGGIGDIPADAASGRGHTGKGSGMGLGLNIHTVPVGYIRMAAGRPEFVPIMDKSRLWMGGMILAGLALLVVKVAIKTSARK